MDRVYVVNISISMSMSSLPTSTMRRLRLQTKHAELNRLDWFQPPMKTVLTSMWSMVQLVSVQLSEVCPELRRAFAEEGTVVVSNRLGYCVVSSSNHAWTTLPLGATF